LAVLNFVVQLLSHASSAVSSTNLCPARFAWHSDMHNRRVPAFLPSPDSHLNVAASGAMNPESSPPTGVVPAQKIVPELPSRMLSHTLRTVVLFVGPRQVAAGAGTTSRLWAKSNLLSQPSSQPASEVSLVSLPCARLA
jgi:hypothetical protein